jgi:hypothetical protein
MVGAFPLFNQLFAAVVAQDQDGRITSFQLNQQDFIGKR